MEGHLDPSYVGQLRAVFLKNLTVQSRQRVLVTFQILPLLVLLAVAGGLSLGLPAGQDSNPWDCFNYTSHPTMDGWLPFWFQDNTNPSNIGQLPRNGTNPSPSQQGLLGFFKQDKFRQPHYPQWERIFPWGGYTPFFEKKKGNWDDMFRDYDNALQNVSAAEFEYRNSTDNWISCDRGDNFSDPAAFHICSAAAQVPAGMVSFDEFSKQGKEFVFSYKFAMGDNPIFGFSNLNDVHMTGIMSSLLWRYITRITTDNLTIDYNDLGITHVAEEITSNPDQSIQSNVLCQLVLWVVGLVMIMPFFMHKIVLERSNGLMEVNRMNGLTETTYWVSLILMDCLQYFVLISVLLVVGAIFKFQTVLSAEPLFILNLYAFVFPLISTSYLLAIFFTNTTKAVMAGYVISLLQAIGIMLLNSLGLGIGSPLPIWAMWYPPLASTRGNLAFERVLKEFQIALVVGAQTVAFQGLVHPEQARSTMLYCLGWSFGFSLVILVIVVYLDQILERPNTINKSPFFPCQYIWNAKSRRKVGRGEYEIIPIEEDESMTSVNTSREDIDDDVRRERQEVVRLEDETLTPPPLLISSIFKEFKGKTDEDTVKAVNNVSFKVEANECFGLLGPNGAGKTTLVNIVAGLSRPSFGRAYISGVEITDDSLRSTSRMRMGLCPQHDILYEDLTVEEHLLFYSRLRGWSKAREAEQVAEIITEVGLVEEAQRLAKDLSGGQQRRLSIGIALCGNPSLIILDEPTSGLDPGSKRGVWGVISNAKTRSSFLMTTHSMEEAEVLCSRIGIMSRGSLKCIGTPQHLKSRFGQGYKIDIVVEEDKNGFAMANDFILSLVPEAKLVAANGCYLSYQTPKDVKLSKIVAQMEIGKKKHGIINWGLSQASLQEVFLTITKQDEGDEKDFE